MPTFEENKHPQDGDGKFTDKDGSNKEPRQNTSNNEIKKQQFENKYNSELPGNQIKTN